MLSKLLSISNGVPWKWLTGWVGICVCVCLHSRNMCAEAAGAPTSCQECLDPRHTAVAPSLLHALPFCLFHFALYSILIYCFLVFFAFPHTPQLSPFFTFHLPLFALTIHWIFIFTYFILFNALFLFCSSCVAGLFFPVSYFLFRHLSVLCAWLTRLFLRYPFSKVYSFG